MRDVGCGRFASIVIVVGTISVAGEGFAQEAGPTGLEVGGVPAIGFDADEGFGYGALVELYQYGSRGLAPYEWTLQPAAFLTTEGRRDLALFFDAPHVLAGDWRLGLYVGSRRQIATPFYGLGNASVYDASLDADDGPNPFYYRFGRTRRSATFTLRKALASHLGVLIGGGIVRTTADPVPEDDGTTLYAQEVSASDETLWSNYVRGGLIWDSRDRESGTRSGSWTEILVQWIDEGLGSDINFTRWTFTDRRYFSLGERVVFAHRYLLQGVSDGAPAHELFSVQSSFKQQEGLGGSKSVRGLLKNRFVGRGMVVWNAELRWRVTDFSFRGRAFHGVLSGFVDQGRVWDGQVRLDQILSDLHRGYGVGARLGMGENFVVAVDLATSTETGMQMYTGLGYLY
jgi:outer membrane protein assembly factor BamA